jgi:glycosyltransferase involved in cell wall biosynthesis
VKKVYHLITTILRGGAENQLLVVVKEQVRQGLEVHVVYLKGEAELEQDLLSLGATVHHELVGRFPLFQPWHMTRLIAGEKIILHAHLPRAELVGLATMGDLRFISTRHNAESFFPGAPEFLSRFLSRMVERRVEKIIAISNSVKKFLLDSGEVKDENKIEVVHYGYFPNTETRSLKSDSHSSLLKLGTISRLAPQKDLPTMILAFLGYRVNHPKSTLSILGGGQLESELKNYVLDLNLASNVEFLGRSSKTRDFLLSLDVFILTSLYEGFGLVLLEAMDAGIPIVASRNSAIPEVLGENFPGLCVTGDVNDFISKISALTDDNYRKSVLEIQERRLKKFSATSMSEKLLLLYDD